MKTLCIDIETAPAKGYIWGLWEERIPIDRIIDSGTVLCTSAKWYHEDDVMFVSTNDMSHGKMLKTIHRWLEQADTVVHFNGTRYDIPILNREFLLAGMPPPAPYKQVDLYKVSRSRFKFLSNKLDYIVQALGLGKKIRHKGFELWVECMEGNPEAWEQMREYNVEDVILTEKLYDCVKPWIKSHPNHNKKKQ